MTATPTGNSNEFLGADPGLTRLTDNLQAEVPAVGLTQINMALWNAIEEFYIRSTSQRRLVNFQLGVGVGQIDFNPYDETWLVAWVLGVWGIPRWQVIPPGLVRNLEETTSPTLGRALLALKPVSFQVTFPPELFSNWFETIRHGTLSKLYVMPAKPWSAPPLAQLHGAEYEKGVSQARDMADRGWSAGGGRWRFPYFARGRRPG